MEYLKEKEKKEKKTQRNRNSRKKNVPSMVLLSLKMSWILLIFFLFKVVDKY